MDEKRDFMETFVHIYKKWLKTVDCYALLQNAVYNEHMLFAVTMRVSWRFLVMNTQSGSKVDYFPIKSPRKS